MVAFWHLLLRSASAAMVAFRTSSAPPLCSTELYWPQPMWWMQPGQPLSPLQLQLSTSSRAFTRSVPKRRLTCNQNVLALSLRVEEAQDTILNASTGSEAGILPTLPTNQCSKMPQQVPESPNAQCLHFSVGTGSNRRFLVSQYMCKFNQRGCTLVVQPTVVYPAPALSSHKEHLTALYTLL